LLIAIQHKKTQSLLSLLLAIDSLRIAISPSRPCDTTEKNIDVVASCNTTKLRSRERRRKSPIVALRVAGIAISFDCISIGIVVELIAIRLDHVSMDVDGGFDGGFDGWFHLAVLGYCPQQSI
jgi:hypothetical protein